jgi:hypothetical protein
MSSSGKGALPDQAYDVCEIEGRGSSLRTLSPLYTCWWLQVVGVWREGGHPK